jgi:hypothetical protein
LLKKNANLFVLRRNSLNKTLIFPFLAKTCLGGTLRISNFKILSKRCIKLAQKTQGAKISASFYDGGCSVGEVQILRKATARDRRKILGEDVM